MKDQGDINKKICLTIVKIQEEYPELIKYLDEIPKNLPLNQEEGVEKKELQEYLDSLNNLLETYASRHKKTKTIQT